MAACVTCRRELPATRGRGRPRKACEGTCAVQAAKDRRRAREGVLRPQQAACQFCGEPVEAGRLYFCSGDHAGRYDALNRAEREWLRRVGSVEAADVSTASAAEIIPGMTEAAIAWRQARQGRIGRAPLAA